MAQGIVQFAALGDVATGLEPPEAIFDSVRELLRGADLRFAQCERLYSERGSFQQQGLAPHVRQHPSRARAFKSVPFDVVGTGSNHTGDWGPEAAEDTVATFREIGIATIGSGRNIEEARKPVVFERNGLRVAFLGYVSVMLPQYWATETRAGSTPMRAHTFYEPYEYQPGSPPRIVTIPHRKDLESMVADIERAKELADVVIASFHWGVHYVSRPIADYQQTVARAAVDAGASVVLGHHPHILQPIALYKGAVVFYSIGNFAMIRSGDSPNFCCPMGEYEFKDVYTKHLDPGYAFAYNRHKDEGRVVFVELDMQGVRKVSIVPTVVNAQRKPEVVGPGDARFAEHRKYLEWVSEDTEGGIREVAVEKDRFMLYRRQ